LGADFAPKILLKSSRLLCII
jgi:hypothetical protein